ncbi:hypothetical protein [Actinomadura macrotermitis]|uniref:DUF2812 domain-containing protein n=1 Tax=Actinomadura macrotermitis TaxID=2585200 RepID=A0A7K0BSK9_9ACTN|nr:hypothetical protein [Actinomadura macrotermitis]MQY04183.1 hypothetical protein [Actinomadura macrotermitis]
MTYFDDLATHLAARGRTPGEITGTIGELTAYLAESGAAPEEEFGPPAEFAAALAPGPAAPPAASAETWTWTADAFQDRARLNEHGDQGWEVERVDRLGRFVSRRSLDRPLRWEYRREIHVPGLAARLAPDGWEPCGTWMHLEYFKRPKAASEGPAGELADPPAAPSRHAYYGRRFWTFIACYLAFLAAATTAWFLLGDGKGNGFIPGALTGATLAALAVLIQQLVTTRGRARRR